MSGYQIGRDLEKLSQRIEILESKLFDPAKPQRVLFKDISDLTGVDQFAVMNAKMEGDTILAVEWVPPYESCNTWDSGSGGNLFVNSQKSCDKPKGNMQTKAWHAHDDVDNNDQASRFLESYFGFAYRNPYASGKLRIKASFFVDRGWIRNQLVEEHGVSSAHAYVFQSFVIEIYKKVGENNVKMSEVRQEYHRNEKQYPGSTANRIHAYSEDKKDRPWVIDHTTELELEKNQVAYIYSGIWSGLACSLDDFSTNQQTDFQVRLDKVVAEIV